MKNINEIETKFEISDSTDDFETFINKNHVSSERKITLRNANILIAPQEGHQFVEGPLFPAGTENIYLFLNENLAEDCKLDICIDDDKYQELALHHEWVHFGLFVLEKTILPLFLACLKEYISKLILQKGVNNVGIKLKMKIVREKGKSFSVDYEGPAEAFPDIAESIRNIK